MKGMRDGYRNECKACNLAERAAKYASDPDMRLRAQDRVRKQWQAENRDRFSAQREASTEPRDGSRTSRSSVASEADVRDHGRGVRGAAAGAGWRLRGVRTSAEAGQVPPRRPRPRRPGTCGGCCASAATPHSATSKTTSTASTPPCTTSPSSAGSRPCATFGDTSPRSRRRSGVRRDHREPA